MPLTRALPLVVLALFVGCVEPPAPKGQAQGDPAAPAPPHVATAPPYSPPAYRVVGDFDGDGLDDYAVGEACGVHGMCPFEVYLAVRDGGYEAVGSVPATYGDVGLCPGSPPRVVTTVRYGTDYQRLEYVVGRDSIQVARVDTSSLAGGGPPDSWWSHECDRGLTWYESTEAEVAARGDSAWRPFPTSL